MFQIKHFSIFILIIISSAIFFSCKDSITDPLAGLPKGKREYTWTTYNLKDIAYYNSYAHLWGSSPENVWIAGHGDSDKELLKFDGKTIEPIESPFHQEIWSMLGLGPTNIWLGDGAGYMYRYNGTSFEKYGNFTLPGYDHLYTLGFWANSPRDIYAVGASYNFSDNQLYGHIMHYDGQEWKYVIEPGDENHQYFSIKRGTAYSDKYYMTAITGEAPDSTYLYEFDGKSLKLIFKDKSDVKVQPSIFQVQDRIYIYKEKKFYKPVGDKLELFLDFSNEGINGIKFWGRSEKDFFFSEHSGIGHYNGDIVKVLHYLPGKKVIFDGLILEKDVYFLVRDFDTRVDYLIHGKLDN